MNLPDVLVVKVGGRVVEDASARDELLQQLVRYQGKLVLVHGGGSLASSMSRKLGVEPVMHEGRRITGEDDLQIAVMVYAGWLNKLLVAQLGAAGRKSIGLSGADGELIRAHKRPITSTGIDYGFVGDIDYVEAEFIWSILSTGLTPIVCAITHDGSGQLLNTNADTIASEIAISIAKLGFGVSLFNCLDKPGVLLDANDDQSLLKSLTQNQYETLKQEARIFQGMIPKLDAANAAMKQGVVEVRLGNVAALLQGGTKLCD